MQTLSTALICKNEARHLPRWLECVRPFSDQIVAVDSGSEDHTVAILEQGGAEVFRRPWQGFSRQRNFAAGKCRGDWVLFLDADEFVDRRLQQALLGLKADAPEGFIGYEIARNNYLCGRLLAHGGYSPEYLPRLMRRGGGEWVREIHERLELRGRVARLEGFLEHHSYESIGDYLGRMDSYSRLAAEHMAQKGKSGGPLSAPLHAAWCFFARYFLKMGCLDGFEGFTMASLESFYTFAKYARLREAEKRRAGASPKA